MFDELYNLLWRVRTADTPPPCTTAYIHWATHAPPAKSCTRHHFASGSRSRRTLSVSKLQLQCVRMSSRINRSSTSLIRQHAMKMCHFLEERRRRTLEAIHWHLVVCSLQFPRRPPDQQSAIIYGPRIPDGHLGLWSRNTGVGHRRSQHNRHGRPPPCTTHEVVPWRTSRRHIPTLTSRPRPCR